MECPHCGEIIPDHARACRYCGSDAETGWADIDEIDYASVDIPEDDEPKSEPSFGVLVALIAIVVVFVFPHPLKLPLAAMLISGFVVFWWLRRRRLDSRDDEFTGR